MGFITIDIGPIDLIVVIYCRVLLIGIPGAVVLVITRVMRK
jgi:hypothetical protein